MDEPFDPTAAEVWEDAKATYGRRLALVLVASAIAAVVILWVTAPSFLPLPVALAMLVHPGTRVAIRLMVGILATAVIAFLIVRELASRPGLSL